MPVAPPKIDESPDVRDGADSEALNALLWRALDEPEIREQLFQRPHEPVKVCIGSKVVPVRLSKNQAEVFIAHREDLRGFVKMLEKLVRGGKVHNPFHILL